MEAIEDVQCLRALLAANLQVGLPHVGANELDLRLIFVMEEASSQRCLSERKRKDGLASRWRCLQVSQEEAHDLLIGVNVIFSGEPMTRKPVSHELIVFVGSLEGFG